MSICDQCQVWLCRALAHRDVTPPEVLSLYHTHYLSSRRQYSLDFDYVAQARHHCWFCARLWNLPRLTSKGSSHRGMLLSDGELIDMIQAECHCEHKHIHFMVSFFIFGSVPDREVMRVTYDMNNPSSQYPCPPFFELDLLNSSNEPNPSTSPLRQFSNPAVYRAMKNVHSPDHAGRDTESSASQATITGDEMNSDASGHISATEYALELQQLGESSLIDLDESESFFSTERISQIESWMAKCGEEHDCSHLGSSVPSRLIQIGDEGKLRLVETSKSFSEDMRKYATLSHCWGKKRFQTLTQSGLPDALQEIKFSQTSKTFQEATELCRRLSINYIWVDSWCIIQDAVEDWLEEAPRMHDVYGSSHLNIAATASKRCEEGLVRHLARPLVSSIIIELSDQLKIHGGAHGGILSSDHALIRALFEASPLFTRGWATQEMYLSPRVLYVTDVQLYWKCQNDFWHEKPPVERRSGDIWSYTYWNQLRKGMVAILVTIRWTRLAEDFSHTAVTVQSDRMMALSGVATRIRETYAFCGQQTNFVAGCWDHELVYWLIWAIKGPLTKFQRKEMYPHLPTWSWLSHPGHVLFVSGFSIFNGMPIHYLLEVKKVNVALPSTPVEYGPLSVAQLTVSAPRFFIQAEEDEVQSAFLDALEISYAPESGWSGSLIKLTNDSEEMLHMNVGVSTNAGGHAVDLQVQLGLDYEEENDPWPSQFECILVGRSRSEPDENEGAVHHHWWFGILVEQVPDSDRYRRIGHLLVEFTRYSNSDKSVVLPVLDAFFGRDPEEQATREYVLQ